MKGFNGQGRILKAGFISLIGLPPPTDWTRHLVEILLLSHYFIMTIKLEITIGGVTPPAFH